MMNRAIINVDKSILDKLHEHSLTLLQDTGIRFPSGKALEVFKGRGFRVDGQTVYFKENMCGNGGRCTVHFAKQLKIISDQAKFVAVDGIHQAKIEKNIVDLCMSSVNSVQRIKNVFNV